MFRTRRVPKIARCRCLSGHRFPVEAASRQRLCYLPDRLATADANWAWVSAALRRRNRASAAMMMRVAESQRMFRGGERPPAVAAVDTDHAKCVGEMGYCIESVCVALNVENGVDCVVTGVDHLDPLQWIGS